jgi:hypothetical protein
VCLYILPFALPPIGSGCPFELSFTLYQEELLYEHGKDETETPYGHEARYEQVRHC